MAFLPTFAQGLLLASVLGLTVQAWAAASLEYTVNGVRGEVRENVEAWLGDPPEDSADRASFLASAEERVLGALKAVGYYRPEVELELEERRRTWQLEINVQPNEPVLISTVDVQLLGEATKDEVFSDLLAESPLIVGQRLHHGRYERFKKRLLSEGQQRGYFYGAITLNRIAVDVDSGSAAVTLYYDSRERFRFGELLVENDSPLDPDWLDSLRQFEVGDYFDLSALQAFQSQLQQTRYFSSVIVKPEIEDALDGRVPLLVRMVPATRHSFEVGVGYSTDTQERLSLTWRTPLINRHGHSQESRLEYSQINPSGKVTYNIPMSHPLNDILQLSGRIEDNEYGDIDSQQEELKVRREIKRDGWIRSISGRYLDESWDVGPGSNSNQYWLGGVSLSRKHRRGSLVDPESGFSQLYQLEGASEHIDSDVSLLRAYTRFGAVQSLGDAHRLVGRLELGAVFIGDQERADLAPSLNFFAGGSQSLRGFSYQSIGNELEVTDPDGLTRTLVVGGDRLLTSSVEYQYYFNERWRGALFVDAGDAFDEGEFDANYAAGFGVHFLSPVGAVRIELANSLSEDNPSWRLHLNIGAEF